jgi:hypothetical protein
MLLHVPLHVFQRDLKVTKMEPLQPQLLPEPAATFAIGLLQQQQDSDGSHPAM